MRKLLAFGLLALLIGLALPVSATSPNPEQSGNNSFCLDFEVLWATSEAQSPAAAKVEVDPLTGFEISQDGGEAVYVDFFTSSGGFAGTSGGATNGTVPVNAAYGLMCVGATGQGWPAEPPAAGATWTYQDGFDV